VGKLVETVVKAQSSRGDWGQESWAPTLGTVMGWTSLRSSHFAGFSVGGSPEKTAEHLMSQMKTSLNSRQHWMHSLYKNATGIRVLYAMGKEEEDVSKKAFKDVLKLVSKDNTAFNQAGGEEFLAFHLITETMLGDFRGMAPDGTRGMGPGGVGSRHCRDRRGGGQSGG
ncbi:MAG: hypothetical protein AAGA15_14215, partial [Pseudomonadota bacterium]